MISEVILSEIMSKDIVSINEETPLNDFKEIFKRRGIHHLIVENSNNDFLGIISSEDAARSQSIMVVDKILAKHIMTENPISLKTNSTLQEAVKLFLKNRWRALPILEDGKLKGIVTPYDIIFYVFVEEDS